MKKLMAFGFLTLVACGQQNDGATADGQADTVVDLAPTELDISKAAETVPTDLQLAAKYDRSCRSCHSTPDAGAPLTAHKVAWDERFKAKDANALLTSTKNGLNAMPAMGLCNDCTDDELMELTAFMAGRTI
ncbi:cytochrome c5 family protein [Sphingorhabdus sp. EL138]|uniref:c-type cytochrome n=1 Tax=Sphingorhabdus sp. EL138 TaxID=2073156 RepID=UPI0013A5B3D9|nr:c-type cytochrome [Sphingorhabdus sp. EL138]